MEENIDQVAERLIEDVKTDIEQNKKQKPIPECEIDNRKLDAKATTIPGLGNYDLVEKEEVGDTLDKFEGVIFKIQNCMFRVCYIDKSKSRFTAEVINLKKN